MRIGGWMGGAARALRRRWPSAVASGAAALLVAVCPFPTEGHSVLAFIGGAGLGGEILEEGLRLTIWGAYKTIQKITEATGAPAVHVSG